MAGGNMRAVTLLASVSLAALLSACAVEPKPFTPEELKTSLEADKPDLFAQEEPLSKPMTLSDAIARALKHNLDHRTKMMEQAMALGQTKVDRWDLLPKLAANAGYANRSDHATTTSRDSVTLLPSLANPSYSMDRDTLSADLTVSWNVLDFGVSYLNAYQNADRSLIAEERRRKTVHNLVQEVRFAFWRAAAAQVLEGEVTQAINQASQALDDARKVEAAKLKNPADALRFQKTLLENLRQLESVSQELSTAKVELAALTDLQPGAPLVLDVPADSSMEIPTVTVPVEQMEETALLNNADIREQGYNARIAADETRKTILKLLPGISFSAGSDWNSNSFLVDDHWYEAGAKLSWNIFNLLSAPDQIHNAEANETVTKARRVALRMAVLAQVHVGYRQFLNASQQYRRADELYSVDQRLADYSKARADNDAQSVIEKVSNQTGAIASKLRRYQSYAQMQSSLGKLHATMGEDFLPATVASHDLDKLSEEVNRSLIVWGQAKLPEPEQQTKPQITAEPVAKTEPVEEPVADKVSDRSPIMQWFLDGFAKPENTPKLLSEEAKVSALQGQ